jgi:hypothetical protein
MNLCIIADMYIKVKIISKSRKELIKKISDVIISGHHSISKILSVEVKEN